MEAYTITRDALLRLFATTDYLLADNIGSRIPLFGIYN